MNKLRSLLVIAIVSAAITAGCGSDLITTRPLPNQLLGVDGQTFTLQQLEDIANDSSMTDEQKMDAFRALGIEDPDLLEAFINL